MYTYLASPYSGTVDQQNDRYYQVMTATSQLLTSGLAVYSPITHCHHMAVEHKLPGNIEFWHWFDKIMITQSNCFAMLTLPGWEKSSGIRAEYKIAKKLGKPIVFYKLNRGKKIEQIQDSLVPELVTSLYGVHKT